jgi:hypothetical protein
MAGRNVGPDDVFAILGVGIVAALVIGYFVNNNTSVSFTETGGDAGGGADEYGAGSTLGAWAQAIASFENVNPAYNNPGGINEQGDVGKTSNGIAMYSSWGVGYNRLLQILQGYVNKSPGMTLDEATKKYAFGPNAGNLSSSDQAVLSNYQATVRRSLGLDGSTPIAWIGGG